MAVPTPALRTLGARIRHARTAAGLTLDALAAKTGLSPSALSLIENGRREPKLSAIAAIAAAVGQRQADLLVDEPPTRRAALEIAAERAQASDLYTGLGLPRVRAGRGVPDEALEAIVGLHDELARRERLALATPEEARRANTELRLRMRERDNALPHLDDLAEERVRAAGHESGALTHRTVGVMAEQLGLDLIYVQDLPSAARSVTDLRNGRIYLPPASIPGGHGLRSMALQAMAHLLLEHERPATYARFLEQRLEINYFAAACLMPKTAAVRALETARAGRNLAVEDFRDAFGVTHEAAALRMTNLLTAELDIPIHVVRVDGDGRIQKAYENDGLPLPADVAGSIEGQTVCRRWGARRAFERANRTTEDAQITDTPAGTFWCSTQTGGSDDGEFSITVGVPFEHARWFRGRATTERSTSTCPDPDCCRRPAAALRDRWDGRFWPSARLHAQVLAPLPSGTVPGVDDADVVRFLERHGG